MTKQEEIREGIAKTIHEWAYKPYSHLWKFYGLLSRKQQLKYLKKADEILFHLYSQGVVIKVDRELPLISKKRAEFAVPETDCSGRKYTPDEWEDNVRYILFGAEIQRDKDKFDSGYVAVEPLIKESKDV